MARRALAVAAVVIAAMTSLSAQDVRGYASLVTRYGAGDAVGAITNLAGWSTSSVSAALDQWLREPTPDQLRAAIMLHTDMAYVRLSSNQLPAASAQVRFADRLVRASIRDRKHAPAVTQTFAVRWYAFTTGMYTAHGVIDVASRVAMDGLTAFPQAAELYVARGRIQEMRATLQPVSLSRATASLMTSRWLESAAADFQRAADLDETLAAAYLHCGRVHDLLGDKRAARDLQTALDRASDDGVRYLAHLFLGAIAERRGDIDSALHQFEAARAAGAYQTSSIALSHAEAALGHVERARDVMRAYTHQAVQLEDPWWDYRLGFDAQLLVWLRREARHE